MIIFVNEDIDVMSHEFQLRLVTIAFKDITEVMVNGSPVTIAFDPGIQLKTLKQAHRWFQQNTRAVRQIFPKARVLQFVQ